MCANEHKYITELCDYIKIAVELWFFFSLIYFCPSWETWLADRFSRIYPHKNQQMMYKYHINQFKNATARLVPLGFCNPNLTVTNVVSGQSKTKQNNNYKIN